MTSEIICLITGTSKGYIFNYLLPGQSTDETCRCPGNRTGWCRYHGRRKRNQAVAAVCDRRRSSSPTTSAVIDRRYIGTPRQPAHPMDSDGQLVWGAVESAHTLQQTVSKMAQLPWQTDQSAWQTSRLARQTLHLPRQMEQSAWQTLQLARQTQQSAWQT